MSAELIVLIPPVSGGVHDYADILSRHLHTRTVMATPDTPLADYGDGDLILNFSGYGYHPRGVPLWLVQRLRQLQPRLRKLGVFFHELYAFTPPWRSAFWLNPTQRYIAAELTRLADFWLTNNEGAAKRLRRYAPGIPHRVLPVYSNIGEPILPPKDRAKKIVIFGGSASRIRTYQGLGKKFWDWTQDKGFVVHDIGPPIPQTAFPPLRNTQALRVHGTLASEEVSRHLNEASHGLIRYPAKVVAKSGVFAAYCAHGVCPVLLSAGGNAHDGLHADHHYMDGIDAIQARRADPSAIGEAARHWYWPHRVQVHAETFKAFLR